MPIHVTPFHIPTFFALTEKLPAVLNRSHKSQLSNVDGASPSCIFLAWARKLRRTYSIKGDIPILLHPGPRAPPPPLSPLHRDSSHVGSRFGFPE